MSKFIVYSSATCDQCHAHESPCIAFEVYDGSQDVAEMKICLECTKMYARILDSVQESTGE